MKLVEFWWTRWKASAVTWTTLAVNIITAHALVFMAVLPFAPFYLQLPLAIGIAVLASAPTWAGYIWKQPKLREKVQRVQKEAKRKAAAKAIREEMEALKEARGGEG